MCGIVGYIGQKKAIPILIQGLKKLEYRGYDSAGIAYIDQENNTKVYKSVGRISELEKKVPTEIQTTIGIGHTRWATHGNVTTTNSHPHQMGEITIVHNGILENYQELKQLLIGKNYQFKSDTDTEVACAYIDYLYKQDYSKNIINILTKCMKDFIGSYAIVIIINHQPNQLFVIKKDSPLIIGLGKEENFIASDISAYANNTNQYIILEDNEIGIITKDDVKIYQNNKQISPQIKEINQKLQDNNNNKFPHYMLKEIYEQKELINEWNKKYFTNNSFENLPNLKKYQKIHIIGCGTAYHAGLIGKYLIEQYSNIEVNVFIASEYRYQKLFIDENTLVIAVSQSGETADTLACIKRVKEYQAHTLGIVNVHDSSIARYVDEVIYTEAGQEIAVASTKAYTSQIYIFSLLAIKPQLLENNITREDIKANYQKLPSLIETLFNFNYQTIIDILWNQENIFYLGRNIDYITMMEGSLKLKEISYIHSEAMPAGELKHGTISLMDENSRIVVMTTKETLASKTISNIKEVKARNAKVILLATDDLKDKIDTTCYDKIIWLPKIPDYIQPIINIIPLQRFAYEIAKKRGLDIDKPRNLAKSVTVE